MPTKPSTVPSRIDPSSQDPNLTMFARELVGAAGVLTVTLLVLYAKGMATPWRLFLTIGFLYAYAFMIYFAMKAWHAEAHSISTPFALALINAITAITMLLIASPR